MDKGWSWVTLLVALGVHALCGGLQHTAGYIRSILLQNADPTEKTYITWIISTYYGVINFVAPFANVLVYKYGCRTSAIVGGSLETLGFFLSFFARDKWVYFISYSFLSAAGSGLTNTTATLLLGFNFERYLSLASWIAVSGQAVGLMIMPKIINFCFDRYGLQGTFLLLGGVTLQKLVFGALMRPSSVELDQISKSGKLEMVDNHQQPDDLPKAVEFEETKSPGADKKNTHMHEDVLSGEDNMAYVSDEMDNVTKETKHAPNTVNINRQTGNSVQSFSADNMACIPDETDNVTKETKGAEKTVNIERQTGNIAQSLTGDNMAYVPDETDNVTKDIKHAPKTVNIDRQTVDSTQIFTADNMAYVPEEKDNVTKVIKGAEKTVNIERQTVNSAQKFTADNMAFVPDEKDNVTKETKGVEKTVNIERQTVNSAQKFTADNMAFVPDEKDNVTKEKKGVEKTVNIERQTGNIVQSFTADEIKTIVRSNITEHLSPKLITIKNKMPNWLDSANNIFPENQTDLLKKATEINARDIVAVGFAEAKKQTIGKVYPYLKVLKIRKFLFFLLGILLYSVPEKTIYTMFPNYFVENGSSQTKVSNLLSLLGTCSAISQFFMGILAKSDLVDIYVLFSAPFGILGVATILLPFYVQTYSGRIVYVIFFGLYNCSVYSLLDQLILRITGSDNFTTAFDIMIFVKGMAGSFGPPFAGFMYMMCLVPLFLLPDQIEE